jgi:hypothetical protein
MGEFIDLGGMIKSPLSVCLVTYTIRGEENSGRGSKSERERRPPGINKYVSGRATQGYSDNQAKPGEE